jgi:flagellar FliJ protein
MKRFRFPLHSVAVVRAHRELRAREALAAAVRARQQAEDNLVAARARVDELQAVISLGRRDRFRAADAASFHQAYGRECAVAGEMARLFGAAQAEVAKRRDACIEANRDLKIVTRLEEKARAAHRTESLRSEQRELDEAAGFGALKRSSSS